MQEPGQEGSWEQLQPPDLIPSKASWARRRSCPISAHTPKGEAHSYCCYCPPNSTTQSVTQSTQLEMELLLHPESFRAAPFNKTKIIAPLPQFNQLLLTPNLCLPSLPISPNGNATEAAAGYQCREGDTSTPLPPISHQG